MNPLASLATSALLGTERRPPDWPVLEGAHGSLLSRIPRDSVEKALLQTAGVLGTCQLAGFLPAKAENIPAPAVDDALPEDPRTDLLTSILTDGPERLQAEAFIKVAAAGRQLPHRLLPRALECGRRSVALRPSLLGVLGRRGEWLAAQNESWAYAVSGSSAESLSDDVWQHGSLDQRRLYLVALRERDAAKARELVREAMSSEGAKERVIFVECLSRLLGLEDQDLLEACLADKSKEVRQKAAHLLASLPGSRYMQRMQARVESFLKRERSLLRGTSFTIEAPLTYDATWKADLIEEAKPKSQHLGERAWWLCQMIACTPLNWWRTHMEMEVAELLAWADKSDWKGALLQGWAEAINCQQIEEWADAFLRVPIPARVSLSDADLLGMLSQSLQERFIEETVIKARSDAYPLSVVLAEVIHHLPLNAPSFSDKTAQSLVGFVKERVNSGGARYDWQLRTTLVELACLLPAAVFDDLANGWDLAKEEVQLFAEAVARIGIVLDQRKQLLMNQESKI
jgi:hypothetical protein